jgi:hypothetical protein
MSEFYKSKTFWASVLIAAGFVGNYIAGSIDLYAAISGIGAAFGIYGIRSAIVTSAAARKK